MTNEVKETYEAGNFDVIVVGAGHAGSEAALAPARMGLKTLLVTIKLDNIAFMPCNPSVGGPAKGTVVREIDALGGEMGRNIDKTYIQMRMLNTSKGPAVRALRAQADKVAYQNEMRRTIENQENLTLEEDIVNNLLIDDDNTVQGVVTEKGAIYYGGAVVLTTGTSSRGEIIVGDIRYSSGPNNSKSSTKLSYNLMDYGFELARFKTGTPPRIDKNTIDYSVMEEQPGDKSPNHFSYETSDDDYLQDQVSCWLTYTNETTHDLIRSNFDRSPMFSGVIEGVGARYCPSIEDKVARFADKDRHQIFIEPEGNGTDEMYVDGLSTSMPEDIQLEMLHTIKGLENAEIMRRGYAIEYDVVLPFQLRSSLETKAINNLYTAGQMNGTSGYEEAAGQGIIAGINAGLKVQGKEPLVLRRDEAYIGVMIDDLVTKGTLEPYRLLTSRAEHRLLLRNDNADFRLTAYGHEIGLVSDERYEEFLEKMEAVENELDRLGSTRLKPTEALDAAVVAKGANPLKDGILALDLLKRPEWSLADVLEFAPADKPIDRQVGDQVEIHVKYAGYIEKESANADKLKRMEEKIIPENFNYDDVHNLANEAREKLEKIRPETLGQASRISGINPSDISFLSISLQKHNGAKAKVS